MAFNRQMFSQVRGAAMQEESTETSLLQANIIKFDGIQPRLFFFLPVTCIVLCILPAAQFATMVTELSSMTIWHTSSSMKTQRKKVQTDIPAYFLFIDSLVSSKAPVTSNMYKKKNMYCSTTTMYNTTSMICPMGQYNNSRNLLVFQLNCFTEANNWRWFKKQTNLVP